MHTADCVQVIGRPLLPSFPPHLLSCWVHIGRDRMLKGCRGSAVFQSSFREENIEARQASLLSFSPPPHV